MYEPIWVLCLDAPIATGHGHPANGRDTCTPSAGDVVLPSLTLESPSDISNAGSITVAEEGDDSFLNDVLAADLVAAAG